jgi:hypothetical protein
MDLLVNLYFTFGGIVAYSSDPARQLLQNLFDKGIKPSILSARFKRDDVFFPIYVAFNIAQRVFFVEITLDAHVVSSWGPIETRNIAGSR